MKHSRIYVVRVNGGVGGGAKVFHTRVRATNTSALFEAGGEPVSSALLDLQDAGCGVY